MVLSHHYKNRYRRNSLAYEMEAMVLVEAWISSARRIGYDEEQNRDAISATLSLIEEKLEDFQVKLIVYEKKKKKD